MSIISPGSRSRIRVAQLVETTRGQTPGSGAYKVLPHLDNTSLNQMQTFERTRTVKRNRMGGLQVGGVTEVGGTIAVSMQNEASVRELIESALSMTFTQVEVDGSGSDGFAYANGTPDTITRSSGSFLEDGFHIGDQIITTNSTTAGNDIGASDLVTITALTATTMTLSDAGALSTSESFASGTTLSSRSYYGAASTTRKFFTHEVSYLDLATVTYEYFRGTEVNTATINIPTTGEVTLECAVIGIVGKITETEFDRSNNDSGTLTAGSSTRTELSNKIPFAGSIEGATITRGGTAAPDVESLSVSINNNRSSKYVIGRKFPSHVEEGDFDVELTMNLYFTDKSEIEDFLNGTRTSLEVTVQAQSSGDQFVMEFPNIVFTKAEKGLSGNTVSTSVTAFAEEDQTYSTKMRVWFIPAASAT